MAPWPSEPVVLQFSLHYPPIMARTHGEFRSIVMDPIFEAVVCGNGFYLISPLELLEEDAGEEESTHGGYSMYNNVSCKINSSNSSTTIFNTVEERDYYGDSSITALTEAPILVQDRNDGSLSWTSWTVYYHVVQMGQPMVDMAMIGSGEEMLPEDNWTVANDYSIGSYSITVITSIEETDESGIQLHFGTSQEQFEEENLDLSTPSMRMTQNMLNNILQLALEVNIMEGNLDSAVDQEMPGARFSLPGKEVITWSTSTASDVEKDMSVQTTNDDSIHIQNPMQTGSSDRDDSQVSTMSMVTKSMYTSHTMRNCGLSMLACTLFFLWTLVQFANRRRIKLDRLSMESPERVPNQVTVSPARKRKRIFFVEIPIVLLLFLPAVVFGATSQNTRPNFVIVLTDDLDLTLGGANASTLTRTRQYIAHEGKTFTNWFAQTPVCCPSRAELLTGKLFHNLRLTNDEKRGCQLVNVTSDKSHPFYNRDYFAPFFSRNEELQYDVGVFGKHLNDYNPGNFMLPGVDEMLINNGGEFLDPTFTYGSGTDDSVHSIHFNTCSSDTGMQCYSTSVIGNASVGWIERQVKQENGRPFMALISVKAPHLQDGDGYILAIPAPWYQYSSITEEVAPRTPHYNYSASDHHWLVRSQRPLTEEEGQRIDALYVSRLKTLISVDDLVEDLILKLTDLQVLDNTYVIFTSDNGYRLGQFRLPIGKLHPYEDDIRVPMMIRGPGISKNSTTSLVSSHVNLMPTLLGIATRQYDSQDVVPSTMDGTNLASKILDFYDDDDVEVSKINKKSNSSVTSFQSSSVLVEYSSLGDIVRYYHLIDTYNHSFVALRIMDDDPAHYPLNNIKYVEFRDRRDDWNMTGPPLEQELYQLDRDPFEMHNIVREVSPLWIRALAAKIQRMIQCEGAACRMEHSTGLNTYWEKSVDKKPNAAAKSEFVISLLSP